MTVIGGYPTNLHLDDYDQGILHERERLFNDPWTPRVHDPRVGDFVRFVNTPNENTCEDYTERRIAYIWRDEHDNILSVQTSTNGSYHLHQGGSVSMSGSLYRGVKPETLARTEDRKAGPVWFFHRDMTQAHNAVHVQILFRIYTCTEEAPRT